MAETPSPDLRPSGALAGVLVAPWLSALDRWRLKIDAAIARNFQALRECDSCWRRLAFCRCGGGE